MPIKRCTTSDGESGYKFGDSGHCYKTRQQALRQMRAIKWQQSHSNLELYNKSLQDENLSQDDWYMLGLLELNDNI